MQQENKMYWLRALSPREAICVDLYMHIYRYSYIALFSGRDDHYTKRKAERKQSESRYPTTCIYPGMLPPLSRPLSLYENNPKKKW